MANENRRLYYAIQRAGIAPIGSAAFQSIRGLQSINVTTTFNLDPAFEIGQLAIYENIEGIPDVEVSTEKVLDGSAPVYLLATQSDQDGDNIESTDLAGRSTSICNLGMQMFSETQNAAIDGTAYNEVLMSGLYVSSVSYQVGVTDNATESVTLVGNNKLWVQAATNYSSTWDGGDGVFDDNDDSPVSISDSGGVNNREDVIFGYGADCVSYVPADIPGVVGPTGFVMLDDEDHPYIQSISISTDFGREELFELGRRANYYRYIEFPTEVTAEITVITKSGDMVQAHEDGYYGTDSGCGGRYNLKDRYLKLVMCEGLIVDAGQKNKLSSVGYSGGDAGGGNVEVTYSYSNYNDFDVKHAKDPVVALRPSCMYS